MSRLGETGAEVVNYRKFTNTDPPRLVQAWNEIFTGRGAVPLHSCHLSRSLRSRPSPISIPPASILAEEDGVCLGFAHAGLVSDSQPPARRDLPAGGAPGLPQDAASARSCWPGCEEYLRQRGAEVLCAGEQGCRSPFYLGLYGGSDAAGFLTSDADGRAVLDAPRLQGRIGASW